MNPIHNIPSFAICAINSRVLIVRYARFIIRNQHAAEDIADTVLLLIWEKRKTLYTHQLVRTFILINTRMACHAWLYRQSLFLRQQKTTVRLLNGNSTQQPEISKAHSPEIPPSTTYTEKP